MLYSVIKYVYICSYINCSKTLATVCKAWQWHDEHANTTSHFQFERFLPFPVSVRHEFLGGDVLLEL